MRRISFTTCLVCCFVGFSFSQTATDCNSVTLPSVTYRGTSVKLSPPTKSMLSQVAEMIKQKPDCRFMVKGYSEPSKYGQQRSWDRVNAVIQYLVMKQGISQQRFVFSYGDMGGNYNTVDLMTTNEEAMAAPAPPHPNLRKLPSKNQ